MVAAAALIAVGGWYAWSWFDPLPTPTPPSADSARVRGKDVAALFTEEVRPALYLGARATSVRCREKGNTPGRGGRWYFWHCSVMTSRGARALDVMWQIDDPKDAPLAVVYARDAQTHKQIDQCCIDDPLQASPRDVEKLFTEPYATLLDPGDGVNSAGCRPGRRDRTGLGNPWRCTLETDSSGQVHEQVRVYANGRFTSPYSGRDCCVKVR